MKQFDNYLSCFLGQNEVPLSYDICKEEIEMITPEDDYLTKLVKAAPLNGVVFRADNAFVYQILLG
jgi:hypothetical protein